jgi:phospholipid/cholesterol/gamma-HCH transport system substrate-binding protein
MGSSGTELRVGIFVTAALVVGGAIVFVIGNRSAMFASKVEYYAVFEEVSGLRGGSPVRIAGIDVGSVSDVEFQRDGRIRVNIEVREDSAQFVRRGSTASIGSKGLLGDQLINLTVGEGEQLPAGEEIPISEDSLLTSFLGDTGEQAEGVVANANRITGSLATLLEDPAVQTDVREIVHNMAGLTRMAAEEDGTVNRLFTDPAMANDVQGAVRSIGGAGGELERTLASVRRIVGEVEHGDGTAHELIYGREGVQLIGSLATAAGEVATILRDIRTGDNNANAILYGDDAGNLIENLTAMSADLRVVVGDVRAGRGTIGGLLMDPSIYEDIKRLVGNLERNEILRSLVRYSIREDEARPQPPQPEAQPQPEPDE